MIHAHPVPTRVRDGVETSIHSLDAWREAWMSARNDPDGFWLDEARRSIRWMTPPTLGLEGSFRSIKEKPLRWFGDGELNVTESCLDRHAEERPNHVAFIWEADEVADAQSITYLDLLYEVSRCANALKKLGVQKGDRVVIYMGMVPQAAVAMLACARVGAVHSVVFGGFSADAIADRVKDSGAKIIITQDEGRRGGRNVPLKATVDRALEADLGVQHVLVYERTGSGVPMKEGRDLRWSEFVAKQSEVCPATPMNAEDPLFILYTSGSTGRPKGLVHTCGGYLTYASYTHRTVFDVRPDDVFACMADVGWITGHTYIVYGPLANGVTSVIFESIPTYPNHGRYWDMVSRHKINIFYTAPTALRTLATKGNELVNCYDRNSLRVLGTVGEPINPEAWDWYYKIVGEGQCTIVDTWWQTETGGICISPIAPATPVKPGCATLPLPGIQPELLSAEGFVLRGPNEGALCIAAPWPGIARTIYGDHERFYSTYFEMFPGYYFAGDGCRRDADGYYWITGRVDDVINVSGHRMGTAEFEAALLHVTDLSETAVVGYPHPVKGQGVYAFIVVRDGVAVGPELEQRIQVSLREQIGAHARVDAFQFVEALPKTRSGKIMRRILRKVVEGAHEQIGDTSTLADPSVVDALIAGYSDVSE